MKQHCPKGSRRIGKRCVRTCPKGQFYDKKQAECVPNKTLEDFELEENLKCAGFKSIKEWERWYKREQEIHKIEDLGIVLLKKSNHFHNAINQLMREHKKELSDQEWNEVEHFLNEYSEHLPDPDRW